MNKILMSTVGFFLAMSFMSSQAFAYITATYGKGEINPNKRTHIIISGKGNDLSTLFQISAIGKAKKYADLYPNEQVYLISANETGTESNVEYVRSLGFSQVVEHTAGSFDTVDVMSEMSAFSQIASVDIFSHSVAYYGVILDGKFNRMDPKKDGYQKLKGNFTADAFAFLHGCNSGQFLAPILSLQWGIPVAGSFTSTDFQGLLKTGKFDLNDIEKLKKGLFAEVNTISYGKKESCSDEGCLRLFPDNTTYDGYWGQFTEGGLGFFKFFCMTNSNDVCFKAMARSALAAVSVKPISVKSSLADYKLVVQDWLCPMSPDPEVRRSCAAGLENALATGGTYDSFAGQSLQCDFKGCKARFNCRRSVFFDLLEQGSCYVINDRENGQTTTQINEYRAYLKGFELLKAEASIH